MLQMVSNVPLVCQPAATSAAAGDARSRPYGSPLHLGPETGLNAASATVRGLAKCGAVTPGMPLTVNGDHSIKSRRTGRVRFLLKWSCILGCCTVGLAWWWSSERRCWCNTNDGRAKRFTYAGLCNGGLLLTFFRCDAPYPMCCRRLACGHTGRPPYIPVAAPLTSTTF